MTVRVGIIGLGAMGRTHLLAYEAARATGSPCVITAVCDRSPERLAGRVSASGNIDTGAREQIFDPNTVFATDNSSDLLRRTDVDLVSICTRTDTHVALAMEALRQGKHVLVEKPIGLTAASVAPLVPGAAAARRLCMPAMCMRFWPAWTWLLEAVQQSRYGRVVSATFSRLASPPAWSQAFYSNHALSGGALFDLHIHDADFVRALLGDPTSVVSTGDLDHVTTLYRYGASGPKHVVAEGGWNHTSGFAFRMRFVVVMEHATADFEFGRTPELLLCAQGRSEPVEIPLGKGYDGEVRHAVEVVAAGGHRASINMEDSWGTARLLDAEYESLKTGTAVNL